MKRKLYSLDDFSSIPSAKQLVTSDLSLGELPTIEQVMKLAKWDRELTEIFDLEADHKKVDPSWDRSASMTHFAYTAAELGWSDEQLLVGLQNIDDRWGKYKDRRDRDKRFLIPLIDRARKKVGYDSPDIEIKSLLAGKDSPSTADRIRVYGADEFAEADFKVDWQLEGLLSEGGMGLITGYPGVGKTQLAIQLGAQLALGDDQFLRWKNLSGKKKVLFMSLEMGPNGLHAIWRTIVNGYEDEKVALNRNLKVYPIGEPVALDTEPGQRFLADVLEEWKPDLLILDSLQKIISKEATDESAAKALFHYLSTAKARFGCSIIIIHHNRKRPNDAKKHVVSLSDVFGSVYLTTDVDFVLSMDKLGKSTVDVKLLKNRFGPDDTHFQATRDEYLHYHDDLKDLRDNFDDDDAPFGV